MNGVGIFFIVLLLLLVAAGVGWVVFTQLRARRLGLPAPSLSSYNPFARSEPSPYGPPTPAPGGIRGWINDKLRGRKGRGIYEQPTDYNTGRRGFGPLDPDEAWDARVHNEAGGYYEEQELGMRPTHGHGTHDDDGPYGGGSYQMNLAATPNLPPQDVDGERGRSRSREPPAQQQQNPFDDSARLTTTAQNPFDDNAESTNISLRGVSPRPIDTGAASKQGGGNAVGQSNESPTERRSIFREDV